MTVEVVTPADLDAAIAAVELLPGPPGEPGKDGADSTVPGPPGRDGEPGKDGTDGTDGKDGADSTVPGPPGKDGTAYNPFATIGFDSGYFRGSTDEDKLTSMNAWAAARSGPSRVVMLDTRQHNVNGAIEMITGYKLVGTNGLPPREYGTGTVWNCTGPTVMRFPTSQPPGQGYPPPPAPRDMTFAGIEWHGGLSTNFIDPTLTYNASRVIWTSQWHNCGWVGFKSIWRGYGDDVQFATGLCHFQAYGPGTMISVGGSECQIFDGGIQSVADSGNAARGTSGSVFLESLLSKSDIGKCMITSRGNAYGLLISGGHATMFTGVKFDAPDGAPTWGSQVKVTGGQDHALTACSFKGGMTNASGALGGSAGNLGFIHVTGGRHLYIAGNAFSRKGNAVPPPTTPLVAASGAAGAGAVTMGFNQWSDWTGKLSQTSVGQIFSADPRLTF